MSTHAQQRKLKKKKHEASLTSQPFPAKCRLTGEVTQTAAAADDNGNWMTQLELHEVLYILHLTSFSECVYETTKQNKNSSQLMS